MFVAEALFSSLPAGDWPFSQSVMSLFHGQPISHGWLMLEWMVGGRV